VPVVLVARLVQVAEQANVGAVMVPLKLAWRPKEVVPFGAITAL
jgi:hypothetical protein